MAVKFNFLLLFCFAGIVVGANRKSPPSRQPVRDEEIFLDQECPEPEGFFADTEQCDKYYDCRDGVATPKLCDDGLVFNDFSADYEKCDLPFNIDCSRRPKMQQPQPSEHCPRKHGYFAHEQKNICDKFYYCVDGKFNMITCPNGLVYNERAGICSWPDEAKREGCTSEGVPIPRRLWDFECPKVDEMVGLTHPRYADPEDCQFFYVCINGNVPRRNGCKLGQVFDDVKKTCSWPRLVPECKDWYKGQFTDEELAALENPPTAKPRPIRRKGVKRPVQEEE